MPAVNLTTRLVLLLTGCITATLLVTTTIDYQISREKLLTEVEQHAETTVAEAVRDLEVRLTSLEESTELLAEVVAQREFTEVQLSELLREAVDERDDLFGAALALDPRFAQDPQRGFAHYFYYHGGDIQFSDLTAAYDYVQNSWFRDPASSGQPGWSEPYFDEGGGDVFMSTYSVPIFRTINGEQVVFGVATADITLDELQYYLDRIDLGPSGFGFLLSTSGKIMAAPNRNNLLKSLFQILPEGQEPGLWGQLLRKVDKGNPASAAVPCYSDQQACTVKLAPLKTTRWPVGVYYREDEMLAPLREYLTKTVLSTGITLLLLIVGVVWISRRITRPLRALAVATIDIATGNFHTELPRAKSADELGRLVHAFSVMQGNLQRYVDQLEQETASRNRLEGELNAATEIQMSMLPAGGTAHFEDEQYHLWAALRPAKSVGGDLYAVHAEEEGRLFIAVGDVSDKGVPAAIFMARAMTLLQQYATTGKGAAEIMARLNNDLVEGNDNCMFVTLFMGWIDLATNQLIFTSGGHTAPSLCRDGHCYSIEQDAGPALGLMPDLEFELNQLALLPGDLLAIYTDGIDEAFNEDAQQFGIHSLNKLLLDSCELSLPELGRATFQAVDEHAGAAPQSDDITLMLLEIPEPTGAKGAIQTLQLASGDGALTLAQNWMKARLAELPSVLRMELLLVCEEVVTNIFKYAQLGEGDCIELSLHMDATQVILEFRDDGIAFDPLQEAKRSVLGADTDAAEIGGLGVHLLEAMTDRQEYKYVNHQNCLRLYKNRS